uniref:Uncharacterized protein n=1 Tax=Micrurus spixii TaxID=129469 RepID=A0A2D4NAB4_9SAUR
MPRRQRHAGKSEFCSENQRALSSLDGSCLLARILWPNLNREEMSVATNISSFPLNLGGRASSPRCQDPSTPPPKRRYPIDFSSLFSRMMLKRVWSKAPWRKSSS